MRWIAALWLAASLAAQHDDRSEPKPAKNPAMGDPQAIQAGRSLFGVSCAACHGGNGEGGRGPNLRNRGAWHPLDDQALFRTIQKGVPGADMPPTNLPEAQVWQLAAFVRSLTAPAFESNVPGNPGPGEAVFWGKGGCSECHSIRGRGGLLGPDLSNVGAVRPLEQLRESVLDPDAEGWQTYRGITVITRDGRTLRGVARNRTNYSVQLQDAQGRLHLLEAADLREVRLSKGSPMPSDFGERLSKQEVEDLLAFLSRQSLRAAAPTEKK